MCDDCIDRIERARSQAHAAGGTTFTVYCDRCESRCAISVTRCPWTWADLAVAVAFGVVSGAVAALVVHLTKS